MRIFLIMKKKIYSKLLAIYCINVGLLSGSLYGQDSQINAQKNSAIVQNLNEKERAELEEMAELYEFFELENIDAQDIADYYKNDPGNMDNNEVNKNSIYAKMVGKLQGYGFKVALLGLQALWAMQDARDFIKQKYNNSKIFFKKHMSKMYGHGA